MIDAGFVDVIATGKKHSYYLDCKKMWTDTNSDAYVAIDIEEVQKVMNIGGFNNFSLLKYYIYVIGTISGSITVMLPNGDKKSNVVGKLTQDYLADGSELSHRSVIDYNKALEMAGVLYIHHQNDFVFDGNGRLKQLPNIYGRPEDKAYIDTFAKNQKGYFGSYNFIHKDPESTNNNRRLAQMYNHLIKGKEYSPIQIQEIYDYVIRENKKYTLMYEKNKDESYLEKIRDVEVFNNKISDNKGEETT